MIVGAFVQGSTIAFLSFFINIIQSQKKTGFSYLDNIISNNVFSLFIMSTILFILLFLSAVSTYYVAVKSRFLARMYHAKCTSRILTLFNRLQVTDAGTFSYSFAQIRKLAIRNSLLMGKSIETLIQSFYPFSSLIVVLFIVLKLNFKLSMMVFPFFLFVLPFLYKLSSNIQKDAKIFYEASVKNMAESIQKSLVLMNTTNANDKSRERCIGKLFHGNHEIKSYYDNFDKMQLANDKAVFITSSFKSFFLVGVLLIAGYSALHNALSWGLVIAYIMAMQSVINNLQNVSGNLSNLNRFYPLVSSYIDFCNHVERLSKPKAKKECLLPDDITITSKSVLEGGVPAITLKPGDRVIYYNKHSLHRINFSAVISPLIKASSLPKSCWYQSCFISSIDGYIPDTIYANGIGGEIDQKKTATFVKIVNDLGLKGETDALPEGLNTMITEELWERLSPLFKLLPVFFSDTKIIIVDLDVIKKMDSLFCQRLLGLLSDRIVFLVTNHLNIAGHERETIIVSDDHGVVGMGDVAWFHRIKSHLQVPGSKKTTFDTYDDEKDIFLEGESGNDDTII